MEIVKLEAQIADLNNQIVALSYVPETFARDAKLPEAQQRQADKLEAERSQIMQERRSLKGLDGQKRMSLIRLARDIQNLRQSRKNLEAVVARRNPATGWEGGLYRVTG